MFTEKFTKTMSSKKNNSDFILPEDEGENIEN